MYIRKKMVALTGAIALVSAVPLPVHAVVEPVQPVESQTVLPGATCIESKLVLKCYDDNAAADAALATIQKNELSQLSSASSNCSTGLRLYDGTGYSGSQLVITSRNVVVNLSWFGFDDRASSYRVGACNSQLFSGSFAGGSTYGGNTNAWASLSNLGSWSNIVSSVRLS